MVKAGCLKLLNLFLSNVKLGDQIRVIGLDGEDVFVLERVETIKRQKYEYWDGIVTAIAEPDYDHEIYNYSFDLDCGDCIVRFILPDEADVRLITIGSQVSITQYKKDKIFYDVKIFNADSNKEPLLYTLANGLVQMIKS